MCGIVGYVGHQQAAPVLLEGLARLEYRGYDSAGVALVSEDRTLSTMKRAGKLAVLADALDADPLPAATTGIGHTRWATHGPPTDPNAHPHLDEDGHVAVIHNGIIENFAVLRAQLEVDPESRASMYQDLERRRKTEVDVLNGEIVRLAAACGVEAPLNRRIVARVHEAEDAAKGCPRLDADALLAVLLC